MTIPLPVMSIPVRVPLLPEEEETPAPIRPEPQPEEAVVQMILKPKEKVIAQKRRPSEEMMKEEEVQGSLPEAVMQTQSLGREPSEPHEEEQKEEELTVTLRKRSVKEIADAEPSPPQEEVAAQATLPKKKLIRKRSSLAAEGTLIIERPQEEAAEEASAQLTVTQETVPKTDEKEEVVAQATLPKKKVTRKKSSLTGEGTLTLTKPPIKEDEEMSAQLTVTVPPLEPEPVPEITSPPLSTPKPTSPGPVEEMVAQVTLATKKKVPRKRGSIAGEGTLLMPETLVREEENVQLTVTQEPSTPSLVAESETLHEISPEPSPIIQEILETEDVEAELSLRRPKQRKAPRQEEEEVGAIIQLPQSPSPPRVEEVSAEETVSLRQEKEKEEERTQEEEREEARRRYEITEVEAAVGFTKKRKSSRPRPSVEPETSATLVHTPEPPTLGYEEVSAEGTVVMESHEEEQEMMDRRQYDIQDVEAELSLAPTRRRKEGEVEEEYSISLPQDTPQDVEEISTERIVILPRETEDVEAELSLKRTKRRGAPKETEEETETFSLQQSAAEERRRQTETEDVEVSVTLPGEQRRESQDVEASLKLTRRRKSSRLATVELETSMTLRQEKPPPQPGYEEISAEGTVLLPSQAPQDVDAELSILEKTRKSRVRTEEEEVAVTIRPPRDLSLTRQGFEEVSAEGHVMIPQSPPIYETSDVEAERSDTRRRIIPRTRQEFDTSLTIQELRRQVKGYDESSAQRTVYIGDTEVELYCDIHMDLDEEEEVCECVTLRLARARALLEEKWSHYWQEVSAEMTFTLPADEEEIRAELRRQYTVSEVEAERILRLAKRTLHEFKRQVSLPPEVVTIQSAADQKSLELGYEEASAERTILLGQQDSEDASAAAERESASTQLSASGEVNLKKKVSHVQSSSSHQDASSSLTITQESSSAGYQSESAAASLTVGLEAEAETASGSAQMRSSLTGTTEQHSTTQVISSSSSSYSELIGFREPPELPDQWYRDMVLRGTLATGRRRASSSTASITSAASSVSVSGRRRSSTFTDHSLSFMRRHDLLPVMRTYTVQSLRHRREYFFTLNFNWSRFQRNVKRLREERRSSIAAATQAFTIQAVGTTADLSTAAEGVSRG